MTITRKIPAFCVINRSVLTLIKVIFFYNQTKGYDRLLQIFSFKRVQAKILRSVHYQLNLTKVLYIILILVWALTKSAQAPCEIFVGSVQYISLTGCNYFGKW